MIAKQQPKDTEEPSGQETMRRLWLLVQIYGAGILWLVLAQWLGDRATHGDRRYLLYELALMVVLGVYTMNLRCPVCRWPVIKTKVGFYLLWVPKKCRNCGHPF